MKWEVRKLGDVCKLITDGTHSTPKYEDSGVPFLSVKNLTNGIIDFSNSKFISEDEHIALTKRCKPEYDDILYTKVGTTGIAKVVDTHKEFSIFVSVALLKIKKDLVYNQYLEYCLNSPLAREQAAKRTRGTANKNLVIRDIKEIEIPIPPLAEQKRIVAILDEVFEKIVKAKENAEKNLMNAKELFDSYLNNIFEKKGKDWEEKKLGECFKLKSGDNLTSKQMNKQGIYPVFGGNGIAGMHDAYNLAENNVIIGRVGALCGNVRLIKEKIWLTDNAFKITDFKYEFVYPYLTYLLNNKNLRNYARQAAQPVISNSSLESVMLDFPKSLSEQQRIVAKLDALSEQVKKLETVYSKKIDDLEELKKSVLQKAFKGEL